MADKRFPRRVRYLSLVVLVFLLAFTGRQAAAQSSELAIFLDWPNEGETFYYGPSSLLYSIYIEGHVRPPAGVDPEKISIRLKVISPSNPEIVLQEQAGTDGHFHFDLTVNPGGSDGQFPAEFADCSAYCHVPGEAALPAGPVTLEITASDPTTGQSASVVRHVTVDQSSLAHMPVNVYLAGDPDRPIEGVQVRAETWIYMWRARHFMAASDSDGQALLRVEALSQAPMRYRLSIKPSIVDGFLYEGVEEKIVDLPPAALIAQPVSLAVTVRQGKIGGTILSSEGDQITGVPIYAIEIPSGYSRRAISSESGRFAFDPLPIDRYLLTADPGYLLEKGANLEPSEADLLTSIDSEMILTAELAEDAYATGSVSDAKGEPLPFAWVTVDRGQQIASQRPGDPSYTMTGLNQEPTILLAAAPGYYSQARNVDPDQGIISTVDFSLIPQPETIFEPWGDGFVVIPTTSNVSTNSGVVHLTSGWIWGETVRAEPLRIRAAGVDMVLDSGRFALEYLPGRQAWFYLREGQAQVQTHGREDSIMVQAKQMVNLMNSRDLRSVSLEPAVVAALHYQADVPLNHTWEPGLGAQIEDTLERVGVGTAQVITFVTYFLVILGILAAPIFVVYWWMKRRKAAPVP